MMLLEVTLLALLVGGLLLALIGHRATAGWINVATSVVTFAASLALALEVFDHGPRLYPGRLFYIDAFNVYLVTMTAFVGMTTSIFSRPYMRHEVERGRVTDRRMRLYHAMDQGFLFSMLLALSTNNLGIMWVAMESATLTTVLLVSLYRTPESIEAAWKYFVLCGVGIAQALFGTVLEVFEEPQVKQRKLRFDVAHAKGAQLPQVRQPALFVRMTGTSYEPPPLLGAHTEKILSDELGLTVRRTPVSEGRRHDRVIAREFVSHRSCRIWQERPVKEITQ